jgi:hypothetical protein
VAPKEPEDAIGKEDRVGCVYYAMSQRSIQ